jgi:hypothetical protein
MRAVAALILGITSLATVEASAQETAAPDAGAPQAAAPDAGAPPSGSSAPGGADAPSAPPGAAVTPPSSTPGGPPGSAAPVVAGRLPAPGAAKALAIDYATPRYEPAVLPTFGGDTDVGAQIGAAGSLTRFNGGVRPYAWNLTAVVSVSFKDDPDFRLVQQSYFVALDVPHGPEERVRWMPATGYIRTINAPYFGRGNATNIAPPASSDNPTQYNHFLGQTFFLRELTRIALKKPYELVVIPIVRYVAPRAYEGSRLAADVAADGANGQPVVHGFRDGLVASLGTGIIVDSRDDEFFPTSGVYHQIGVKIVEGVPVDGDVNYADFGGVFAGYIPIGAVSTLALRGVVDFQVGNVPFFDAYSGGPFRPLQLPGGSTGVRGVPLGLYSGLIKMVANAEFRSMPVTFHVLRQKIRLGGDAFFDIGRAFSDYTFDSSRDGTGVGLHWGTGAGLYFAWGDAALIRAEVAYSPSAFDLHLPFGAVAPLGIYVQDGVMF